MLAPLRRVVTIPVFEISPCPRDQLERPTALRFGSQSRRVPEKLRNLPTVLRPDNHEIQCRTTWYRKRRSLLVTPRIRLPHIRRDLTTRRFDAADRRSPPGEGAVRHGLPAADTSRFRAPPGSCRESSTTVTGQVPHADPARGPRCLVRLRDPRSGGSCLRPG